MGPEVSTVLSHNSFTNCLKDKKMLRSKASHNQALSGRNGVGMGLALESGTGAIETAKLRPVMDQHRKNYEACDRNGDHRGSAIAHGALGSVVTGVGGRKAEGEPGRGRGGRSEATTLYPYPASLWNNPHPARSLAYLAVN